MRKPSSEEGTRCKSTKVKKKLYVVVFKILGFRNVLIAFPYRGRARPTGSPRVHLCPPHLMPILTKRCTGGLTTSEEVTHPPSQRQKVMETNGSGTAAGSKVQRLTFSAFWYFPQASPPPPPLMLLLILLNSPYWSLLNSLGLHS